MRKVLVLGGNGFLGRNLCRHLVEMGEDVYSFDMSLPEKESPGIHYLEGDFFDDYTLQKIIDGMDVIYHAICTLNPGNLRQITSEVAGNYLPARTVDAKKIVLENNRIRAICAFPLVTPEEGIRRYYEYIQKRM